MRDGVVDGVSWILIPETCTLLDFLKLMRMPEKLGTDDIWVTSNSNVIHLVDNQATLGVLSRGRSGSRLLNRYLRRLAAHALAAGDVIAFAYVPTDTNPADVASRVWDPGGRKKLK